MLIRKLLAISTTYILSAFFYFAQAQDFTFSEEAPINIGATLSLHSDILSEERELLISLPADYHTSSKHYPVIYMLDAQYFFQFQYIYGVINALEFMEEIPQVILVGIHSVDRAKDLSTAVSPYEGHADKFLEFIQSELQPFINQQYRTEPYEILIGHSAGGFFGLYTLLNAPDTFNGYIAIDPALQFDGVAMIEELNTAFRQGQTFNNSLFVSSAGDLNATDDSALAYSSLITALTETLPDDLQFSHQLYPDEDHTSTILPGFYDGILSMYEYWKAPDSISSLDALLSHYQSLSEHYGYTVDVPVTHASDVGFQLISSGDPEAALEVFEYRLANISDDAIAHYSVGFALKQLGRLDEALLQFETAIELGSGTDMYTAFIRFRDEVVKEISNQDDVIE